MRGYVFTDVPIVSCPWLFPRGYPFRPVTTGVPQSGDILCGTPPPARDLTGAPPSHAHTGGFSCL